MSDRVNHPPHYNAHPANIECIDVVEHMTFNLGNAVKYIWRAGLKSENTIEDLRKASWYLEREIGRLQKRDSIAPSAALADSRACPECGVPEGFLHGPRCSRLARRNAPA
jgi:hypothetical protein